METRGNQPLVLLYWPFNGRICSFLTTNRQQTPAHHSTLYIPVRYLCHEWSATLIVGAATTAIDPSLLLCWLRALGSAYLYLYLYFYTIYLYYTIYKELSTPVHMLLPHSVFSRLNFHPYVSALWQASDAKLLREAFYSFLPRSFVAKLLLEAFLKFFFFKFSIFFKQLLNFFFHFFFSITYFFFFTFKYNA